MKTQDLLILGGIGLAAYYFLIAKPKADTEAAFAGGAGAIQEIGEGLGNWWNDLFGIIPTVPGTTTGQAPIYSTTPTIASLQNLTRSMVAEQKEAAERGAEISAYAQAVGAAPPSMHYVKTDKGIGVMPSVSITKEAAVAGIPAAIVAQIPQSRVAYQAAIGVPIQTAEQYLTPQVLAWRKATGRG